MPVPQRTEADLITAVCEGDQRAFEILVRTHRDRLWGVCLRITGNRDDAEDALQDTLVFAWRNLARFRGEARLSTWLFRIASNAAIGVVRKRREVALEIVEDADPRSDFVAEISERDRIQDALHHLPESFRSALVLREYGDLSYEEIAQHQGILVATVKTRINRARALLRRALAEA